MIKPEDITVLIDRREQLPWNLAPMKMEESSQPTADYTLKGLEDVVAVERKSLPDLLACVGRERERFDREMHRILAYPKRYLIIESTWEAIEAGRWRNKVHPNAVYGSLVGWIEKGIHVCLPGDVRSCERFTVHLFYMIMRRHFDHLEKLKKQCLS